MDGLRGRGSSAIWQGGWSTAVRDPGVWYSTVREGGCRFMAAWMKEEEKASQHRQRNRAQKRRTKLRLHLG